MPLFVCLTALCVFPAGLDSGQGQPAKPSSSFQGRTIVHQADGTPVPPNEAKVWVLFGSSVLYEGMPNRQEYVDSAALQFESQRGHFLAQQKKTMESLLRAVKEKSTSGTGKEESLNMYQGYMIGADDRALAGTMTWVQGHNNKSWQVKIITPDQDGTWFVGDLVPGIYQIVVRARFGDYDAEWEAGITVKPAETFAIPEGPPRLFSRSATSR
jgi:hypothetical protein